MPTAGSYDSSSSLFRALVPVRSYAQMAAQKDQELRYASALAETERIQQLEQQQKIQQQQQTLAQLKALPFEGPDQRRLKTWVLDRQKDVANRIETEYNGDERKFIETEGEMWLQDTLSQIQSSDLYNTAVRNKEMISMAKSAIQKGDNLIGRLGEDGKYINAEQDLLNYYAEAAPTFTFSGSYKPDTKIYDHFGKLDNPYGSKFDNNSFVKSQDVMNFLQSEKGDKQGMDLYFRQFNKAQIPFKRYSLEDQQLFGVDLANKRASINQKQASTALSYARIKKLGEDDNDETKLQDAVPLIAGSSIGTTPFQSVADPKQKINSLGVTLGDLSVPGANGQTGLEFTEIPGLTLGPSYSRYSGIKKGSQVKEGIVPGSGKVIDLNGIPNTVIESSPSIFVDQSEYNKATKNGSLPGREFKKTTVRILRDDAIKAGLVEDGSGWTGIFREDELSKNGVKARVNRKTPGDNSTDIESIDVEMLIPTKGFFNNPEVKKIANKAFYGQKGANDISTQIRDAIDEFQSSSDD